MRDRVAHPASEPSTDEPIAGDEVGEEERVIGGAIPAAQVHAEGRGSSAVSASDLAFGGSHGAPFPARPRYKRGRFLELFPRFFDGVETRLLDMLFGSPFAEACMEQLGVSTATLYRGVSAEELESLQRSGMRYDATDPRNRYKFATPNQQIAENYALKTSGHVIEVMAERAVAYYKVSQLLNGKTFTEEVQEYLIFPTDRDVIRVL